jgi:hypothetical protein
LTNDAQMCHLMPMPLKASESTILFVPKALGFIWPGYPLWRVLTVDVMSARQQLPIQRATRASEGVHYLLLAICLAVAIVSAARSCVFAVEVEILYWMYWGGFVCVYASAPYMIRLGKLTKWVSLDWTTAIFFVTHWVMAWHGLWIAWSAYDHVFAHMPCGTFHAFIGFVPCDPSEIF